MNEPLQAFGQRLEAARRYYGRTIGKPRLKMNAFAQLIGSQPPRYRRWERGEMEPPLWALLAIRKLTGLSLDWLIGDLPPGLANIPTLAGPTPGDRLRWAREIREPNPVAAAQVMSIPIHEWQAYESGQTPIPLQVAQDFCRRFGVSLDYLYEGKLEGCHPDMRAVLLSQRPQLLAAAPVADQGSIGTGLGGGSSGREGIQAPLRQDE